MSPSARLCGSESRRVSQKRPQRCKRVATLLSPLASALDLKCPLAVIVHQAVAGHMPNASASETMKPASRSPAQLHSQSVSAILRNHQSSNAPHRADGAFMKSRLLGISFPFPRHAAHSSAQYTRSSRAARMQAPNARFPARSALLLISPEPLLQFPCAIGGKKSIVKSAHAR